MSADISELLQALETHLEELKAEGTKHLPLTPALSEFLSARQVVRAPATPARGTSSAPAAPTPKISPSAVMEAAVAPISSPVSAEEKAKAFEDLRARALVCQKCPNLVTSRKSVVFGVGSPDADLMFVGEAPGADEDVQGEPFVGRAGQLLTKIIQTMGLSREEVYIANILKCRPDTPGQTSGNRKPSSQEMSTCLPYLHAQIDLIQPKVLVALGGTAVEGLLGESTGITRLRGNFQTYRGIPLMPTYHPSFLLRPNPKNVKREVWEDMMRVMEKLEMPISEKQRGYFLNS
jgi:uracil-DNA glycosylase family 4